MPASVFAILSIVGVLVAYAFVVGWLDRRTARLERERLDLESRLAPDDLPPGAGTFLGAIDRSLELPADLRAEIRAELHAHLSDSIEALEAEGLDGEAAAREATARLGRPEELARQLRAAHQTTRRLLAGAAGGVFWTGVGLFEGWVIAIFLLVLGLPAILAAAWVVTALHISPDWDAAGANTLVYCLLLAVTAFIAARRGNAAVATISRRPARRIGRCWGVSGAAAVALLVLFVVPVEQTAFVPPAELAIAAAFAAGALVRPGRALVGRPPVRAVIAASLIAFLVPTLVLVAAGTSQTELTAIGGELSPAALGWDRVAREYPGTEGALRTDGAEMRQPVIEFNATIDGLSLAGWRDVRFEAWRSRRIGPINHYAIDARFATPFATEPAVADSAGAYRVRFELGHVRSTDYWTIFLTGVGPDGGRYRIGMGRPAESRFNGTIWDWMTAAE